MLSKTKLNIFVKNLRVQWSFFRGISSAQDIVIKSPFQPITYPKLTIDQYVWKDYNRWINKPALVDGITDRTITYAQLRDQCRTLAIHLRTSLKLQPRDTVAICLPNSLEFPIITLASSEAEVIITTLNPLYTPDEIARQLSDSGSKILFGWVGMSPLLQAAVAKTGKDIRIVYVASPSDAIPSDGVRFSELLDPKNVDLNVLSDSERDCDEMGVLLYSSGTTGLSKGVKLSHKNIVVNSLQINAPEANACLPTTDDFQDVLPCVMPFFHSSGLTGNVISRLAMGCRLVPLPNFNPATFLSALVKYQGTVVQVVPPISEFYDEF